VAVAVMNVFSVAATRQAHLIHEHVSGVDALAFAKIGGAATASAQVT
jgi:hypothetical protein